MKFLLLLIPVLFYSNINTQLPCDDIREGRFNIPLSIPGYEGQFTYLERKGPYQIETTSFDSKEVQYRVSWLDDCTYVLFNRKLLKGKDGNFPHKPSDSIIVSITRVTETYYDSIVTSNFADMELNAKIFIEK